VSWRPQTNSVGQVSAENTGRIPAHQQRMQLRSEAVGRAALDHREDVVEHCGSYPGRMHHGACPLLAHGPHPLPARGLEEGHAARPFILARRSRHKGFSPGVQQRHGL
jgi:hypothetical protein